MSISSVSDSPLIAEAKKKAKHLRSILNPLLPEISLGACLNIFSRLERERDWNAYCAKLKQRSQLDIYIIDTILPKIIAAAATHQMKAIADNTKIQDFKATNGKPILRRVPIRIEPKDQQEGETYSEVFLDVSMASLRLGSDWFNIGLKFVFPSEAFSVLAGLLSGEKISNNEPGITRYENHQKPCYILTVNTSGISDTSDPDLDIISDPMTQNVLEKGLERFFSGYCRAVKAYLALRGKWGNKKLVNDFENTLWKLNNDLPPYMSVSNEFYFTTIAGLKFSCALGSTGPCIIGPDGSVELGVCSIVEVKDGGEDKPEGYYIAKYGDSWQTQIHLKNFSERDIKELTTKFGIPRGRFPEGTTSFYQTPAFKALCYWTVEHPKVVKRIARNGGRYLPDWYEQVMAIIHVQKGYQEPTEEDFLKAIEKEPYLIDFGIRCSFHIDRKKTAEENRADFLNERQSFAASGYREFSVCCEWLHGCKQRKTINTSFNSYSYKHMVEAWAKRNGSDDYYVSNGAFIAAAIHMGYHWKLEFDSPNVMFNISAKSPAIPYKLKAITA